MKTWQNNRGLIRTLHRVLFCLFCNRVFVIKGKYKICTFIARGERLREKEIANEGREGKRGNEVQLGREEGRNDMMTSHLNIDLEISCLTSFEAGQAIRRERLH